MIFRFEFFFHFFTFFVFWGPVVEASHVCRPECRTQICKEEHTVRVSPQKDRVHTARTENGHSGKVHRHTGWHIEASQLEKGIQEELHRPVQRGECDDDHHVCVQRGKPLLSAGGSEEGGAESERVGPSY